MSTTYFISGHRDLTEQEFELHYIPAILVAMVGRDAKFVIGDCAGADKMAQDFLMQQDYPRDQVKVFHMFTAPRNNAGFPTEGGFKNDIERDTAMMMCSHEDIAWVRQGKEASGTAQNLERRNMK